MKPLVSVIIPMYNARQTIGHTLESLQQQTLTLWNALVVDDGSTDGSADIVRGLAQEDPRITLLYQANRGPGAARNVGIERADGWFLNFLDADDTLEPAGLRALVDRASADPSRSITIGRTRLVGPQGQSIGSGFLSAMPGRPGATLTIDDLLEDNPIQLGAALVRRDLLSDLRFSEHQRFALDYDLWLRLALRAVTFRQTPDIVGSYRLRPGSQSRHVAEQLRAIDTFLADAYAAARESVSLRRALDASDIRRSRVMARFALRRATALALTNRSHVRDALLLLTPYAEAARGSGWSVTPADAAQAAHESILHTTCAAPTPSVDWATPLAAFWLALVERQWADSALIDHARHELAARMVDPALVANTLLDRAGQHHKHITLVGLGNNGRLLAEAAMARGLRVLARDDALVPGHPDVPKCVTMESPDAPLARDGAVIITPLIDSVLVARCEPLAPGRILRWTAARDTLAAETLRAIEAVWVDQPARLVA